MNNDIFLKRKYIKKEENTQKHRDSSMGKQDEN
jgi:hypothetical protein